MAARAGKIGQKIKAPLVFLRRQVSARPFAVGAVCFLAGILVSERLHWIVWLVLIAIALFFACIRKFARFRSALMLAFVFALGGLRMQAAEIFTPMVETQFSTAFTGTVVSDPVIDEEKERIICVLRMNDARVRLYIRSDVLPLKGIEYGQTLECFGHVWAPEDPTNPYQFDQENWLKTLGTNGMAAAKLEDIAVVSAENGLGRTISGIRAKISERIDVLFPKNAELVRAFVLGDRTGLDDALTEAFQKAGIAHLICISGMHVSVLALAVSALLGTFLPRRAATIATIGLLLLYGTLIGFPASFIRAVIMFTFLSASSLFGRISDSVTRIAIALAFMLFANPFYVLNAGFVLSFGATAGLILLDAPIKALFGIREGGRVPSANGFKRLMQRILLYFQGLLASTIAAQIAILPAVIRYFGMQSPISVPANLLSVPLAMLAYPLALASVLLSTILLPAGKLIACIPERMFSALSDIAKFLSEQAVGNLQVPNYPIWLALTHAVLCVLASDLTRIRMKIRKFMPLVILALLGVSMLVGFISSLGFGVIFLDAGQADAAILHAGGHVYMIDVGDVYTPAADYAAATCTRLDAVFLSHPHRDHAGGLTRVLSKIRPGAIYLPEGWYGVDADEEVAEAMALAEAMNIPIYILTGGDILHLPGNVTLTVTAPNAQSDDDNDCSQLLAFTCRNRTILFTGDLTQAGEPDEISAADVLKVPHHGSEKSCSADFLNAVDPEIAVLSVGRDNSYGHPAAATLQRLRSAGCAVYRTDQLGAISVTVHRNGAISVKSFLPVEESE